MESIGQILKAARERRQISIADVVVATKMTSAFVKAIEADDFDALVAPVYARGFIKLYAECVGLDPMPLLKQFDVSRRAAPAPSPPPSKAPPRKTSVAYAGKLKPKPPLSWLASLLAGRLSALNRMFSARVQWPRFKLPSKVFPYLPLPAIVWRRIFIVAFVVLLIIAASLAWEWSHRGMPSTTDACRWLAEPPAPYLTIEEHTATFSR